jgi:chemotaxis protein MotA
VPVIAGIGLVLFAIVASTIMDGNSFGPLIGPSSFLLVFLAAVGAAMVSSELSDMAKLPKAIVHALKSKPPDLNARIDLYMELAELARRDGLLGLESRAEEIEDPFVRYGLQMVTDGTDEEELKAELGTWARAVAERHGVAPSILRKLGAYAPAFGMVGTVIGLVNMLGNLSSPEKLGGGMALALLTTLYGSLFANLFFQPLAERLEKLHEVEMSGMSFDADAICALQSGTNPRSLVAHLESLLPPSERQGFSARSGKAA